jgi:hypothetical protein
MPFSENWLRAYVADRLLVFACGSNAALFASAVQPVPFEGQLTTSALEDRLQAISNELTYDLSSCETPVCRLLTTNRVPV